MLFLVAGASDTKVRRSTGVTTANSTIIRNTVELGDQLGGMQTNFGMEFKAHLYVPKLHGRLGAVDDGEVVGQR